MAFRTESVALARKSIASSVESMAAEVK